MKGRYATPPSRTLTNKWLITLEVEDTPQGYDELKDKDLRIDIKEYKNKRSNEANAYFYVLVNKIAEKLNLTDTEVHDKMLADNISFIYKDGALDWKVMDNKPNKYRLVCDNDEYWFDSRMEVMLAKPEGGFYEIEGKPKTSKIFWHIKGSHQMDTKEMSRLIEGTVQEAQSLGIDTMTPDEVERMMKAWRPSRY